MEEPSAEENSQHPEPSLHNCPQCGEPVDLAQHAEACAHCGTPLDSDGQSIAGEEAEHEREVEKAREVIDDELSGDRIRNLSRLSRATYRTRSYLIMGTVLCLWLGASLLSEGVKERGPHNHWGAISITLAVCAFLALLGAGQCVRRWIDTQRQINAHDKARAEAEKEAAKLEPDLSTLSDGSQRFKNLEKMVSPDELQSALPGDASPDQDAESSRAE